MTALLGSILSRHGSSPRAEKHLQNPPTLPSRFDPASADAKILGPLSKRREVNLRWRFFKEEIAKVRPPIEVSREHVIQASMPLEKSTETGTIEGVDTGNAKQPTPPPVGFQGTSILRDLESIASPSPNIPRRAMNPPLPNNASSTPTVNHFIRRQHRKLLREIPILTYFEHPDSPAGKYQVSLSPLAPPSLPGLVPTIPMADEADLAWLNLPPPCPRKPGVEQQHPTSRGPGVREVAMADAKPKVHQIPRVDWVDSGEPPNKPQYRTEERTRKPKPEAEERPKVKGGVRGGSKPSSSCETGACGSSVAPRSGEPPVQLEHHQKDGSPWNSSHSSEDRKGPKR